MPGTIPELEAQIAQLEAALRATRKELSRARHGSFDVGDPVTLTAPATIIGFGDDETATLGLLLPVGIQQFIQVPLTQIKKAAGNPSGSVK